MSTRGRSKARAFGAVAAFVVACTSQSAVTDSASTAPGFRVGVNTIAERCYRIWATSPVDSAEASAIQPFALVRFASQEDSTLPRGMRVLEMPNATRFFSLKSRGWGIDSLSDSIRLSASGPMGGVGIVLGGQGDSLFGYATGFGDMKVDNPPWATVAAHRVECAMSTPK